jgi:hypothetical protein
VSRLRFLRVFPLLTVILLFAQESAQAKFILEFTNGRKMTVSNYEEIGQNVKVYTPNGSFSFRKEDIVHISDLRQPRPTPPAQPAAAPHPTTQIEASPAAPVTVMPKAAAPDPLPSIPGWDGVAGVVMEGLYRGRFFVALFVGLKALQFFLPTSFR